MTKSKNSNQLPGSGQIDEEIALHYCSSLEEQRLAARTRGRAEFLRPMEILACSDVDPLLVILEPIATKYSRPIAHRGETSLGATMSRRDERALPDQSRLAS